MRVCIIVFSPSGHTLKAGRAFEARLIAAGHAVQLVNITRTYRERVKLGWAEFLRRRIAPHDLLCVGAPVYAGHLESNAKSLLNALPAPGAGWGRLAIPFVSYGGLHSSIALREAGNLLYKKGRINVMGFKMGAFHTLTLRAPRPLYPAKPDQDDLGILDRVVERIVELEEDTSKARDCRRSFSYAPLKERIIFSLLSQDFFHEKHRINSVDTELCNGCGRCVSLCPVEAIVMEEDKAVIRDKSRCILCAECYHYCPRNAVTFPYMDKVRKRAEKGGILESPVTRIYSWKVSPCDG